LKVHINDFAILVYCSPQVMLLAVDSDEDFIDVESIAIASVLSLQSPGVKRAELDTPEADRFATDGDASLGEEIFDIS